MATAPQEEFTDDADLGAGEDIETQQHGDEPEQTEEYARRLGWKPKDEFKGAEDQWKDWQDFLNEDLSTAPQLKAQVKLLRRRLDQADRRNRRVEKTLEEVKGFVSRSEERGYERALKEIQAKQRAAVAMADEDAFDEASAELEQLNKDMKAGKKPEKSEVDPDVQKAFKRWEAKNDWYGSDVAMTAVADALAQKMGTYDDMGMDPDEYLEVLTEKVQKEFPERFNKPKKRSAVEGVPEVRANKGQESFDNLPAEAKQQFKRFEEMGIPVTKDQFTKDAWAEIRKGK